MQQTHSIGYCAKEMSKILTILTVCCSMPFGVTVGGENGGTATGGPSLPGSVLGGPASPFWGYCVA
jgi:hypothetical protein